MSDSLPEKIFKSATPGNIYPFFWLHGKDRKKILPELEALKSAGIKNLCVESRGHTDFLSDDWFLDLDVVMDFARNNGMKVWLLDDAKFPTGYANGAFKKPENKNKGKKTLKYDIIYDTGGGIRYFDIATFYNMPYFNIFGSLEAVILARRGEKAGELFDFIDVSDKLLDNGLVRLELEKGRYAVIVVYTMLGGGRNDYMNLLDGESVDVLIENVYEPHFERYKDDFSKTFCGFFSDEPELGNYASKTDVGEYRLEDKIGDLIPLPFSDELRHNLKSKWRECYGIALAGLWFDKSEAGVIKRSEFMEEMTLLVKNNFSSKIGAWCDGHNVEYAGHVLEDQNSHARLSAGAGHYFRSTYGMTYAGIDVVLGQVLPDENDDTGAVVFSGKADREFYSYALAPLASSCARLDKRKKGRSLCEIFGAYGWSEGTSLMKYLADLMLSGGINTFVPHAFSDAVFPDFDCPPHFFADGKNPQFCHFKLLIGYMDRVSGLISGGKSESKCAVLYHAEAEWSGINQLMQKPVKVLSDLQVAFDIVSLDMFFDKERYDLPMYEYLFVPNGLNKIDNYRKLLDAVQHNNPNLKIKSYEDADKTRKYSLLNNQVGGIRAFSYIKDGLEILLVFNTTAGEALIEPKNNSGFIEYDVFNNKIKEISKSFILRAKELKILIFDKAAKNAKPTTPLKDVKIDAEFLVSMFDLKEFKFIPIKKTRILSDMNEGMLDRYAGIYRYDFSVNMPADVKERRLKLCFSEVYDSLELKINGKAVGVCIAPPFVFDISEFNNCNSINVQAEVFTTLGRAVRDPFSRYRALEPCGIMGNIILKIEE